MELIVQSMAVVVDLVVAHGGSMHFYYSTYNKWEITKFLDI